MLRNLNKMLVMTALWLMLSACTSVPEGVVPVNDFNIDRYLGKWYEVARFDHSFERGLSNVTATYSLREDGGIDVINRGFHDQKQEWDEAKGKAYFVDSASTGHLKVSFFGPFYASYVIAKLDMNDYSYSLVTGPNRDYLWVLAREPSLPPEIYDQLIETAKSLGYDINKLIRVKHSA